jgi:hypothetical protein
MPNSTGWRRQHNLSINYETEHLVANWCRKLYPAGEAAQRAATLVHAVREINAMRADRDLPPLISTPLMTTMVVSVAWR